MSASPSSDSPVLNRCKNVTKGRLKFELVVQCNRYQQVTYSQNLVCLVSEGTITNVSTYQWQDQVSNTHSHHKSVKDQFVLAGYMRMKYPNLMKPCLNIRIIL